MTGLRLDPVPAAIAEIAAGRPVVVVDDEDRENEGDLILAAATATPAQVAFAVRHSSGSLCAPMSAERADALEPPLMVADNADPFRTAYTLTVDAAERGHHRHLRRGPGPHPHRPRRSRRSPERPDPARARRAARAKAGGVLERRGHTEAAVDLTRMAGLPAVGMIVELVHDDGTMRRGPALRAFADQHGLAMISIEDLAAHRREIGEAAGAAQEPVTATESDQAAEAPAASPSVTSTSPSAPSAGPMAAPDPTPLEVTEAVPRPPPTAPSAPSPCGRGRRSTWCSWPGTSPGRSPCSRASTPSA
uniref:3,4-dihydroxy-2-butanone-4-phosphate synthase n=1 Tax=Brachybacterium sp. GPGPB12 TaxID=3023517 RepID=UPI0040498A8C